MSKHERAVRKALKAFEPMVPPHVMTALEKVIEEYLLNVIPLRKWKKISNKDVFTMPIDGGAEVARRIKKIQKLAEELEAETAWVNKLKVTA